MFTLHLEDGSRERFTLEDFHQNLERNAERLQALYKGAEMPPPHPFGAALSKAVDLSPELQRAARNQQRVDAQIERSFLANAASEDER